MYMFIFIALREDHVFHVINHCQLPVMLQIFEHFIRVKFYFSVWRYEDLVMLVIVANGGDDDDDGK